MSTAPDRPRITPAWTRVGLTPDRDGWLPTVVIGVNDDELAALRSLAEVETFTSSTEPATFDDGTPAVVLRFDVDEDPARAVVGSVLFPLGDLLGAAAGWSAGDLDYPDVPWVAVPADRVLPPSGRLDDDLIEQGFALELDPEAIAAAASGRIDPEALELMEGMVFGAPPDPGEYEPVIVSDTAALDASIEAFLAGDAADPLAALRQGLGGLLAGAGPGPAMFTAMEEQAIAERRDLWIAVAAVASGLPAETRRLDTVAEVAAMPALGQTRFLTIVMSLLFRAVQLLADLPDAVTSDAALPASARRLYRSARRQREQRALEDYADPRAALDDVVTVAGWAARTVATHSRQDRLPAGAAADLVADLLDNRDVWVDAISAAAGTPPLAAALFAGLVQELQPDSPAVADLDRLAGELRRLRSRLPQAPTPPALDGITLPGVDPARVPADATALLEDPSARVSALAAARGWPQAATAIAAALVAVAAGHAAAHGGAPGDVVRSLLARWRFLTDAV